MGDNKIWWRLCGLVLLLLMVWTPMVWTPLVEAQSSLALETLARANQLYENGRFEEAARIYQQLVDAGVVDVVLFYNAGNAYYKQGDIGRAIVNYERARRLAPRDDDIAVNLALAQASMVDSYDGSQVNWWTQLVLWSGRWLTVNELAWLTLMGWLLLALAGVVWWGRDGMKNGRWVHWWPYLFSTIAIVWLGSGLLLGGRIYLDRTQPQAVIVAESVNVVSGPGPQYATEFILHSGAQVGILEHRRDWVRLALPGNQLQGWVMAEAIELIGGSDNNAKFST